MGDSSVFKTSGGSEIVRAALAMVLRTRRTCCPLYCFVTGRTVPVHHAGRGVHGGDKGAEVLQNARAGFKGQCNGTALESGLG